MAFFKRNLSTGILVGVAAGLAAREVFPRLGDVVKPLSKVTLRSGILAYEKMKEAFAHVGESIEDLASEVRTEMATEEASPKAEVESTEDTVPLRKHSSTAKETKATRETNRHVS